MELATPADSRLFALIRLATDGLPSRHSRRSYARSMEEFIGWMGDRAITKGAVREWQQRLQERGLSAASINLRLAAVRRFATEAADNGLIPQETADAIRRVKGIPKLGERTGNWLTLDQAERLINAPRQTPKGVRDRALLGLLIGCGLRREECAGLQWSDVQQREGRWVIVDLHGKGGRIRTVPVPSWAKMLLDRWREIAVPAWTPIFCPIRKGGEFALPPLEAHAIYLMVRGYAQRLGFGAIACHDLRRTFAKLAHKGGAKLEQVQISLGHASIKTTEVYLRVDQDLQDAPADRIHVRVE